VGWVTHHVSAVDCRTVRVELKGPDDAVRVRGVRVLGHTAAGHHQRLLPQLPASVFECNTCEQETLKVFRLLTSLVRAVHIYDC
jgi:hypothetical protein